MKKRIVSIWIVSVLLLFAPLTSAAFLIDTGEPTGTGLVIGTNTVPADPGQVLSLKFNLVNDATVTTIYPFLGRLEEGLNLRVWLSKEIGPTAQDSDIVASWTIWGIPGSESFSIWFPIQCSTPLSLDAGFYYLTLATGTDGHAVMQTGAPIANGGNFYAAGNKDFPVGSHFYELQQSKNLGIRVEGVYVPEPATVLLFGLSGMILRSRQRKH